MYIDKFAAKRIYLIKNVSYLSGRIVEYDIKAANISILHQAGAISDEYYQLLQSIPKISREIAIGNLIKEDNEADINKVGYQKIISDGIAQAKIQLFKSNNINPDNVVRIANDAVYINSSLDLKYTKFGDIEFRPKGIYTSMLILANGQFIIFMWRDINGINIDVKGLGDDNYEDHQSMLSIIVHVMYLLESNSYEQALIYLRDFYLDYINLKLDVSYYRSLIYNGYLTANREFLFRDIKIDDISQFDINDNLFIISELYSIVLGMQQR